MPFFRGNLTFGLNRVWRWGFVFHCLTAVSRRPVPNLRNTVEEWRDRHGSVASAIQNHSVSKDFWLIHQRNKRVSDGGQSETMVRSLFTSIHRGVALTAESVRSSSLTHAVGSLNWGELCAETDINDNHEEDLSYTSAIHYLKKNSKNMFHARWEIK